MMADEKSVTLRECDTKHMAINETIKKLEYRMEKIETKFWWIITLLIGNLVGVITLLIKLRL